MSTLGAYFLSTIHYIQTTKNTWTCAFVLHFKSAGKNNHFEKFYPFLGFFSHLFDEFHWTSKVYATLTMGNRFLGMQISIIWVVFSIKQSHYCGNQLNAQDIATKCHSSTVIRSWNLIYSHYDHQGTSADFRNKNSTPDTWIVEAVYWHKKCIAYVCGNESVHV